jgi:hypothetical protein
MWIVRGLRRRRQGGFGEASRRGRVTPPGIPILVLGIHLFRRYVWNSR